MRRLLLAGVLGWAGVGVLAGAQQIQFGEQVPPAKKAHVVLLTDSAEVTAGATQDVELRFRVQEGFHINSHAPKDELLLPTALTLEPAAGVKVVGEEYPKGAAFRLPGVDGELDVYQNEFRVRLRLVMAERGSRTVTGALRYQACDNAACFPPRTLPVLVLVTAK